MRRRLLILTVLLAAAPALARPPSWDRRIDSPKRWKVLKAFDGQAVLDQETGLVWARASLPLPASWLNQLLLCRRTTIGGRSGWRLPRYEELQSIIDNATDTLPPGHPFDVPAAHYWSATESPLDSGSVLMGDLDDPSGDLLSIAKTQDHAGWCVRGPGAGIDGL